MAQLVKNPPAMWVTWVPSLGWEYPLEKGKATHSHILAWRIPWTVESMGSQRVGHNWVTFTFTSLWKGSPGGVVVKNLPANTGDTRDVGSILGSGRYPWSRKWQPIPVSLPGKLHGQRSLVATVHWVVKSWTWLSTNTHTYENTQNPRYWQYQILVRMGVTRILIHCWWEWKIVKPLWKTVWHFVTKLNILLP